MNLIERVVPRSLLAVAVLSANLLAQSPSQSATDSAQAVPEAQAVQGPAGGSAKAHDSSYVIGNDDKLAISVWKEPDLTRAILVRSDGKISLPLVGEMQAAGRTPLQLEQDIANRLRNYITVPEVTVIVDQINSKKYNILGQVGRPGAYPLTLSTTVMDAIAAAGGFKDFAKSKGIYILRQNPDGTQSRLNFNYKDFIKGKNLTQNVKLEPRDTIIVP
jgi:polysaccharide export outer membrane protein